MRAVALVAANARTLNRLRAMQQQAPALPASASVPAGSMGLAAVARARRFVKQSSAARLAARDGAPPGSLESEAVATAAGAQGRSGGGAALPSPHGPQGACRPSVASIGQMRSGSATATWAARQAGGPGEGEGGGGGGRALPARRSSLVGGRHHQELPRAHRQTARQATRRYAPPLARCIDATQCST